MAPTPIQDIDFPALRDKILELLRALWTFASELCIALWSYVSQAFWAVWTYPPFESFRNEFVAALIALMDYGPCRFSSPSKGQTLLRRRTCSGRTSHHYRGDIRLRVRRRSGGAQRAQTILVALFGL